MKPRPLAAAVLAVFAFCLACVFSAEAGRQTVALFAPENLSGGVDAPYILPLAQALAEKLQDRFDVRIALPAVPAGKDGPAARRKRARALGTSYILAGILSRIGKTVTLDLTLDPVEEQGKGRTVVATATDNGASPGETLPPAHRRLATEASAKLKYLFFGDEIVGEGASRRKIPRIAGTVTRSNVIPGEMTSVAFADTDGDGRSEVVAAFPDSVAIYGVAGDDLAEKARLSEPGAGIIRVDAADVDHDGTADIVVVRYHGGNVSSDIWKWNGKGYARIEVGIPWFLRTVALGGEGTVLVGQEPDPVAIFRGPVFRVSPGKDGRGGKREKGASLPLPDGIWIYAFTAMRWGGGTSCVSLGDRGQPVLNDSSGKVLGESLDIISGTETVLDAPVAPRGKKAGEGTLRLHLPGRMIPADLDGDGNDEVVAMNNLLTAGGFFEGIRVFSGSEALCFARDGESLRLAWRTSQFADSARDAFLELSGSGKLVRIGVASPERGKILGKAAEWRILWLR